jgi:DNA-binding NarL/FixJ family response regulator
MIKVLLADDHEVVRIGIGQFLLNYPDIQLVASVGSGGEAVTACAEHNPDVVLMDLVMPGVDGVEATRQILTLGLGTRVIVLTSFSDRERILDAIDAGATGYMLKDSEPEELLRGIRAAARGESPLSPRAAQAIVAARQTTRTPSDLTPRETEVLVLLARGMPNKEIARTLGISEKTVKAHLTNVFQRIGVSDRTQAALWAERRGLVAASRQP